MSSGSQYRPSDTATTSSTISNASTDGISQDPFRPTVFVSIKGSTDESTGLEYQAGKWHYIPNNKPSSLALFDDFEKECHNATQKLTKAISKRVEPVSEKKWMGTVQKGLDEITSQSKYASSGFRSVTCTAQAMNGLQAAYGLLVEGEKSVTPPYGYLVLGVRPTSRSKSLWDSSLQTIQSFCGKTSEPIEPEVTNAKLLRLRTGFGPKTEPTHPANVGWDYLARKNSNLFPSVHVAQSVLGDHPGSEIITVPEAALDLPFFERIENPDLLEEIQTPEYLQVSQSGNSIISLSGTAANGDSDSDVY
ncbi:uncharacterized protein IL334_005389 [Kwoniella shivajii]|uniref:Fungal-type protein kinase domain-containing protein n=1 Tax=Kwoniella shivajii TaxID=564305 RepID=A0ABZ1D3P2_9TREE|nr:hypothetical protein IL334_005389 [Kwoniella shivajii]